jgi:hypothetical protein
MPNTLTWEEVQIRNLERFDKLLDRVAALERGMAAIMEAIALKTELDDLRAEVMERVATPFDPPEAPRAA